MKTLVLIPLALLSVSLVAILGAAGCYRNCNPDKDPTCPCPPGACGPYPEVARDAGPDR